MGHKEEVSRGWVRKKNVMIVLVFFVFLVYRKDKQGVVVAVTLILSGGGHPHPRATRT